MWLTNLAIKRRVTMIMVIGALMILGLTRLTKMPVEYFPKFDIPVVSVLTTYPGAGPDEVQQRITKPVEDAVSIVNGAHEIDSSSQENVSAVTIQFTVETNGDVAAADVRDAVTRARQFFPDDAKTPVIYKVDFAAFPVVTIGVTGKRAPKDLYKLVDDQLKPVLGQVGGVASVNISGGEVREVRVEAHEDRLEAVGLSVSQLAQTVAAENLNVPSGELKEGGRSFAVRAMGQFRDLEEIRHLRVRTPLGGIVYLSDLADVLDTTADPTTITRTNGEPSVTIDILKQSNANTVLVSEGVRRELDGLEAKLPKDIHFTISHDSAVTTREAINDVRDSLILGVFLAALVTYLFLQNLRAMVIVVLAIPTSMLATFLPIYFFGFTVNVMVLLALSLSVGILVDDSIVVIENIERHRKMGEEPQVAALNGRAEIGGAAVAITLVDVVVFVPVAFMGGIVGRIFYSFGITVTIATLFSLFMSFTLTPMLTSWWLKRETVASHAREEASFAAKIRHALDAPFNAVQRLYRRILPGVLRHPWPVVIGGYTALIVITALAFGTGRVGMEFFPGQATGRIEMLLEAAPGTRIEVMDQHLREIEAFLLDHKRFPEIRDVDVTAGAQGTSIFGAGSSGGQYGYVRVMLYRKLERAQKKQRTDEGVETALRAAVAGMPSLSAKVVRATSESQGAQANLQLVLQSADPDALDAAAAELASRMKQQPGMFYVDLSAKPGRPEVRAQVDRLRTAEMGLTAAEAAGALRAAYAGDTTSKYRVGGDEYDVRVQLANFDRQNVSDVASLLVGMSPAGQLVRLRDVADVYLSTGPSRIDRFDRERSVTVSAFLKGIKAGAGQQAVEGLIRQMESEGKMPGVRWQWSGEVQRMTENFAYIGDAMMLAIILVYIITAALYTNILQPWNVLLTVPQALGGAILALALVRGSISLPALIGMIMLLGVVGKNSILVVDYTNTLKARGKSTDEALLEAGPTRMRPIFMTTIAIIMALLPTALARSEASEFRAPMAIVVIGGTLVSTLLSLLVVPSFYKITDGIERSYYQLGGRLLRALGRLFGRGEE